jgi:23S rRNA (cytidine1920-2'-O)/16S rRNA (cytidine1409-2'-O)-methyltransferase
VAPPDQREGGRRRADQLLVERALAGNRTQARALILAGRVVSAGVRVDKAGSRLAADAPLAVSPGPRFVSRGGIKLEAALERFEVGVVGRDALDVGASTGGFTQALLARGATRVIALDVGRGLLDFGLRRDARVYTVEGLNARYLTPDRLPFVPSLAVIDVSFISLRLVLPAVVASVAAGAELVTLVKPQFEVGRGGVGAGGVVRDPERHREVLEGLAEFACRHGLGLAGVCASPIRGAEGNREFFLLLRPGLPGLDPARCRERIGRALDEPEAGA